MHVLRTTAAPLDPRATQHSVRMRDGVRLATDHYPAASGKPGPTVLIRLPYDKSGAYTHIPEIAHYLADHDYHVVAQDVRGKFRSEGETLMFVNETADGYDTIQWIVDQEWSDGIVGMWGESYYGYTQWAAVASQHPALRAISPRFTGTDLGMLPVDLVGVPTRDVEMAIHRLYPCTFFHSQDTFLWEPNWKHRPYADNVEAFFTEVGHRSAGYDLWFPEPVYPRRFPCGHPFTTKAIPVLMTIGWWDNCAPWQWADHRRLRSRAAWAANEYLRIEAVDHECYELLRGEKLPERSREEIMRQLPTILDPTIEFFEVFLRDRGSASDIPRVRWNLATTDEIRTAESWPPPGVEHRSLHLSADGDLVTGVAAEERTLTWVHDPDDLVPSRVSNPFAFLLEYPDESEWGARPDVLEFNAAPVTADTDLVGAVNLCGTISSTGPRMDLFVRLLDVAPDGTARLIARGQTHLVDASTPTDVTVDLFEVGYRLRAGHGLRIHIASSDFPEFLPQPGNGQHPWLAVDVETNQNSIVVGGRSGAVLTFHVLP